MLTRSDDADMDVRRWNALPIEPSSKGVIRLQNAGLTQRGDVLVAHGWLDLESIGLLRVDEYQREVLTAHKTKNSILRAVMEGAVLPDIMLGMRGQRIKFPKDSSVCELLDPVYIVDGLQRVFALRTWAEVDPDRIKEIRIGAEVRFDTTKQSERELFNVLNTRRTPVSPNVILRNLREEHPSILTLYGLSHFDKDFALYERVCWNQRMSRQELVTAMIMVRAAKALHQFTNPAIYAGGSDKSENISRSLDESAKAVSLTTFRRNIVTFWDVIDACYGVRTVEYNQLSSHLRGNFLVTLSRMMALHENFWDGNKLLLDTPMRRKLAAFPVQDPEVARLCAAGNMTMPLLYAMLIEHMNKGKRINRLTLRRPIED